jgi:hypothetical protein
MVNDYLRALRSHLSHQQLIERVFTPRSSSYNTSTQWNDGINDPLIYATKSDFYQINRLFYNQ